MDLGFSFLFSLHFSFSFDRKSSRCTDFKKPNAFKKGEEKLEVGGYNLTGRQ